MFLAEYFMGILSKLEQSSGDQDVPDRAQKPADHEKYYQHIT